MRSTSHSSPRASRVGSPETLWQSQNYLHSPSLIKQLLAKTTIICGDFILEIGPGKGIITRQLANIGASVLAIEYDAKLYRELTQTFHTVPAVTIRHGDVLASDLPAGEYKIFSNIPFQITSAILAYLTRGIHSPVDAYLIIQREAALRYAGRPYARECLKSLLIKPNFVLTLLHNFNRTDFKPCPGVDIVLLHLQKRKSPLFKGRQYQQYKHFMCYVFTRHGKDLRERLKPLFTREQFHRLAQHGRFPTTARPIDLSFTQWLAIFTCFVTVVSIKKQRLIEGAEDRLRRRQGWLVKIHRSRK